MKLVIKKALLTKQFVVSELHAAAKETVTLAEQRFVSKQDEWQFDSNWQEVLNHAIIKVSACLVALVSCSHEWSDQ